MNGKNKVISTLSVAFLSILLKFSLNMVQFGFAAYALLVSLGQALAGLGSDFHGPQDIQLPADDQLPDGLSLHELHGQEGDAVALVHVVDLGHSRVVDGPGGAGLLPQKPAGLHLHAAHAGYHDAAVPPRAAGGHQRPCHTRGTQKLHCDLAERRMGPAFREGLARLRQQIVRRCRPHEDKSHRRIRITLPNDNSSTT